MICSWSFEMIIIILNHIFLKRGFLMIELEHPRPLMYLGGVLEVLYGASPLGNYVKSLKKYDL